VRNVVIVSIDTLRSDRLEAYGYVAPTSPNLSALARRSVLFASAQAQASQTAPSHASLFTSEYAGAHGIVNVHGRAEAMPTLPEGVTTLAEVAASAGLETAAFVSGGNLTQGMAMDRGFALWDERNEDVSGRVAALMKWMADPARGRFLALVHTYQVHAPYVPPRDEASRFTDPGYDGPLRGRYERYLELPPAVAWAGGVGADYWEGMLDFTEEDVAYLSDLYDAEIAYTDRALRPLLEALLTGERAADTALVVLSDHGEEFLDHGKYQHDQVFEELVHVPLLVRLPSVLERGGWRGRVEAPVELVDVAPTVAELLGVDGSVHGWSGRSLVGLMRPPVGEGAAGSRGTPAPGGGAGARAEAGERARFSELVVGPGPKRYRSVTWQGWKYIHAHQVDVDVSWEWLFDLRADPEERVNHIEAEDGESAGMRRLLRDRLAAHTRACEERAALIGETGSAEVSDAMREELLQLGY
jgi:arylsulfatase A-like enzyme